MIHPSISDGENQRFNQHASEQRANYELKKTKKKDEIVERSSKLTDSPYIPG